MTQRTDVLIVGGGPTGLVLAVELARRGVAFRLVDKLDAFFGGSRADGLVPRTLEVFDDIGIADTVMAEGDAGILVRGYRGDEVVFEGRATEPMPARPDVPYPNIWFLPQFRTEELLRERLAALGHHVELRTELIDCTQDADGVVATLAGPRGTEQVRVRYLVGADGGASVVRKRLGIPFVGETDESARVLFGDVRVDGLDRSHGRIWTDGEQGAALMPLAGTDLFTITAEPPANGEVSLAYLQDMVTLASGDPGIRLRELTWSTIWRPNVRLAERFRDGRVFLVGDAAHINPPTGGQGMNTGIGDSYNLGWKLAAVVRGAPAALLDSYETERRPAARRALDLANNLLEKHRRGDEDAHVRGPELHQLTINYRGGSLAEDRRAEPGPVRAGDRAPDAPCGDVRLFDLFRGPHWTVLAFGPVDGALPAGVPAYSVVPADGPAGDHVVVDTDGHARDAYQVDPGTIVLVRPDGYIGLVTTAAADVERYLAAVGDPVAVG
ncbi:MAG TPA: FAD-dependent monooxygenase [Pseudonocardiaceae bacterium]|jgi:2-polyprenyl-6-methoxyphenol hydroxylase-like FAD-dependent oxidoreductase|nr:FAD-dependent monooxygenase [Pseudonocardiaceae bacterium]